MCQRLGLGSFALGLATLEVLRLSSTSSETHLTVIPLENAGLPDALKGPTAPPGGGIQSRLEAASAGTLEECHYKPRLGAVG